MQKAELVLSMLRRSSTSNKEFVFDRLYRKLFNPDLFLLAYNNIYSKEGNMTPGVDSKTIDGFSDELVDTLIEELRYERYHPQPVKRVYIPKKNGKKRPLGIPSFREKLVQEVVRLILETIFEPLFEESSHGFRPRKGCHTALERVKRTFTGANWVIEGDITGFFDNIDHGILLRLLKKKIKDGRFIRLVSLFLKAGYMEDAALYASVAGCPQGGLVSPVLANIYLHELDGCMERL